MPYWRVQVALVLLASVTQLMSYSDAQLLSPAFLGRAGERCLFPCKCMLESYWLYIHWVLPYVHIAFFFIKSPRQTNVIGKVALGSEGLWSGTAVKPRRVLDVDREQSCGAWWPPVFLLCLGSI